MIRGIIAFMQVTAVDREKKKNCAIIINQTSGAELVCEKYIGKTPHVKGISVSYNDLSRVGLD